MTFTSEVVSTYPGVDEERAAALHEAVRFHCGARTDDPKTVVDTAEEFLGFLQRESASPASD